MNEDSVLLFIDAIEDDEAFVLLEEKRHRLPRALLPAGAGEGMWLRLSVDRSQKLDEEVEARRARLLRADPGGDIKL
jgi:Protein of unknown function (DUF3006)